MIYHERIRNLILVSALLICTFMANAIPVKSIETSYTILNVRNLKVATKDLIVGSSYEGTVLCYNYDGKRLWQNKLSGFMNNDIYCGDLDGDKKDEILVANANGNLYCLDSNGKLRWTFKKDEAPMMSVCIVHKGGKPYVACGGYGLNLYYLDANGKLVSTIPSETYCKENVKGVGAPEGFAPKHMANFLRPMRRNDGTEILAMHGAVNSMASGGCIYLFEPLAKKPYKFHLTKEQKTVYGSIYVDGSRLILGSSKDTREGYLYQYDINTGVVGNIHLHKVAKGKLSGFGYRVAQCVTANVDGKPEYIGLFGSNMLLMNDQLPVKNSEVLSCKYSFYDIIKNPEGNKLILASAQSGGSCIHILDLNDKGWKKAYEKLQPIGKIASILNNSSIARKEVDKFNLPKWETLKRPVVYFMSENPQKAGYVHDFTTALQSKYPSPVFLNNGKTGGSENPITWSRDTMSNEFYKNRRDRRQKYNMTQDEILYNVSKAYEGNSRGMAMWGGHGNDPFYYCPATTKKILQMTGKNQQTVLIYPEMEGRGKDMVWLMNNFMYPLANVARDYNSKLYIRSKHAFWFGNVYEKQWSKLVSGEYSDVFVPSMEETTDKSMDLGLSGRMGMWMSGAVNSWGSRCARDNASFNRLRQFSHQTLPNNFLRNMVYYISLGSQYIDNFSVDQEYMSLLWEMIAKGVLYVPNRSDIVSINPVHLSIIDPDEKWLDEGNNVKWVCFYDSIKEKQNPYVMSHLNGSWPGAPVTEWDFSRYAAGAKERRLNFISSYNNGLVLLTPPTDKNAPRGNMEQYMNPIYKGALKEFFTDGRYYYSDKSKTKKYSPTEYYKVVENAIIEGSKLLPLTVKGEAGWVVAKSAPKHLRLTVIDGGYINPSDKNVVVKIGTAKVKFMKDVLTGEEIKFNGNEATVTIPCGLFRFFDVELAQDL